jgi:FlaA1/EpsC-like NDP-sugar epimerase
MVARYGQLVLDYRAVLVVGVQLGLIVAANLSAFELRFDAAVPVFYDRMMWRYLPGIILVFGSSLWVFGIQQGLWRYVGLHDLGRIFWASLVGAAVFYGLCHVVLRWAEYPRSIIILTGLLTGLYLASIRVAVRWFREWIRIVGPTGRRVLIVGAGHAGELLVRDILSDAGYNSRPVGFVDDDPIKRRMKIHGIPVVGTILDIKKAAEALEVTRLSSPYRRLRPR